LLVVRGIATSTDLLLVVMIARLLHVLASLVKAKFHYAILLAGELVRELVCDLLAS